MIGNVFTYGASSHGVASELLTAQGLEVMGIKGSVVTSSANGIYPVSHNPSCIDEAVLHDLNVLARKSPIVQLSMNKLHGVALTSLGSVFTFGAAEDGRLGRSVSRNRVDAVTKLDKYKIVAVAVGESHSAAVTDDGSLYTWGRDQCGQLGHWGGSTAKNSSATKLEVIGLPRFVSALHRERIKTVCCGAFFTAVTTAAGEVWTFGEGRAGQLGIGAAVVSMPVPTKVVFDVPAAISDEEKQHGKGAGSSSARGRQAAGSHSSRSGSRGKGGSKGRGTNSSSGSPSSRRAGAGGAGSASATGEEAASVETFILSIATGHGHMLALSSSNHVFVWGMNTKGQLGLGDFDRRLSPVLLRHAPTNYNGVGAAEPTGPAGSSSSSGGGGMSGRGKGMAHSHSQTGLDEEGEEGGSSRPLFKAKMIAAGGNHSAAVCLNPPSGAGGNTVFPSEGDKASQQLGESGRQQALPRKHYDVLYTWGSGADGRLGQAFVERPAGAQTFGLNSAVVASKVASAVIGAAAAQSTPSSPLPEPLYTPGMGGSAATGAGAAAGGSGSGKNAASWPFTHCGIGPLSKNYQPRKMHHKYLQGGGGGGGGGGGAVTGAAAAAAHGLAEDGEALADGHSVMTEGEAGSVPISPALGPSSDHASMAPSPAALHGRGSRGGAAGGGAAGGDAEGGMDLADLDAVHVSETTSQSDGEGPDGMASAHSKRGGIGAEGSTAASEAEEEGDTFPMPAQLSDKGAMLRQNSLQGIAMPFAAAGTGPVSASSSATASAAAAGAGVGGGLRSFGSAPTMTGGLPPPSRRTSSFTTGGGATGATAGLEGQQAEESSGSASAAAISSGGALSSLPLTGAARSSSGGKARSGGPDLAALHALSAGLAAPAAPAGSGEERSSPGQQQQQQQLGSRSASPHQTLQQQQLATAAAAAAAAAAAEEEEERKRAAKEARLKGVEEGTWQLKVRRTPAHLQLCQKQKEYALVLAATEKAGKLASNMYLASLQQEEDTIVTNEMGKLQVAVAEAFARTNVRLPISLPAAMQLVGLPLPDGQQEELYANSTLLSTGGDTEESIVGTGAGAGGWDSASVAASMKEEVSSLIKAVQSVASMHVTGERSTADLNIIAASVGIRMKELPEVKGAPWMRTPPAKDLAPNLCYPKALEHPAMLGREIVTIYCSEQDTTVLTRTVFHELSPRCGLDTGGTVLSLRGPGMSSVCRLAYAYLDKLAHLTDESEEQQMQQAQGYGNGGYRGAPGGGPSSRSSAGSRSPSRPAAGSNNIAVATAVVKQKMVRYAGLLRPDHTGLVPIPGVLVRFTKDSIQPGQRVYKGPAGGEPAPLAAGGLGGAMAGLPFQDSSEGAEEGVLYSKAYFPRDWQVGSADLPGKANDNIRIASDGSLFHSSYHSGSSSSSSNAGASAPNLDVILAVAPSVRTPCTVTAEVLIRPPSSGIEDLLFAEKRQQQAAEGGDMAPSLWWTLYASQKLIKLPGSASYAYIALPLLKAVTPQLLNLGTLLSLMQRLQEVNSRRQQQLQLKQSAAADFGRRPVLILESLEEDGDGSASPAAGGFEAVEQELRQLQQSLPEVQIGGDGLFGCALVDPHASAKAEQLIDDVQLAILAREKEEAGMVAATNLDLEGSHTASHASSAMGMDGDESAAAGSGSAAGGGRMHPGERHGRGMGHAISAALGPAGSAVSGLGGGAAGGTGKAGAKFTLSTLHLSCHSVAPAAQAAAEGKLAEAAAAITPGAPSVGALVRFSVLRGDRVLFRSAPVPASYTCRYDEALLHLPSAVDKMTGTQAEEADARVAVAGIAGLVPGSAGGQGVEGGGAPGSAEGGGGSSLSSMHGSVASVAAARGGNMRSGGAAAGGGAGWGGLPGSGPQHSMMESSVGSDFFGSAAGGGAGGGGRETEEGVVGKYTATLSCLLPSTVLTTVQKLSAPGAEGLSHAGGAGGSSRGDSRSPAAPILTVPSEVQEAWQKLRKGSMHPTELLPAGVTSPASLPAAAPGRFSLEGQYRLLSELAGGKPAPPLQLRPEVSVDGGWDFVPATPAAFVTTLSASVSHAYPPCMPAVTAAAAGVAAAAAAGGGTGSAGAGSSSGRLLTVRGSGFVSTGAIVLRLTPLWGAEHAAAAAAATLTVPGQFVDGNTVRVEVPQLQLPPLVAAAGAGSVSPAGVQRGYCSYKLELSLDGQNFLSNSSLRLIAYATGSSLEWTLQSHLLQASGAKVAISLPSPTIQACWDAFSCPAEDDAPPAVSPPASGSPAFLPNAAVSSIPPLAVVGHPSCGLGSINLRCSLQLGSSAPIFTALEVVEAGAKLLVTIPAVTELPGAGRYASSGTPLPPLKVSLLLFDQQLGSCSDPLIRFYDPSGLSISAVGPVKKIALGGDIQVTVAGLDELLASVDAATAACFSYKIKVCSPSAAGAGAGAGFQLTARLDGTVKGMLVAALPANEPSLPINDVAVGASVDGGITFTAAVPAKIAKK